jgi:protein ImuB
VLRLAAPEANAARLLSLLRERLATLALPEPVRRCDVRSGVLVECAPGSKPLWSPGERGHAPAGEMPALIEHLRARLGTQAVYGLARVSEHRPENAWRVAEPALEAAAARHCVDTPRRPLWLLHVPQELEAQRGRPRHHGPLKLLAGPERIESGWWDGEDQRHDYYVVQTRAGQRAWAYVASGETANWMLQGWFA